MPRQNEREKPHEFTKLAEFDRLMRKLVEVPKEAVERRETVSDATQQEREPQ